MGRPEHVLDLGVVLWTLVDVFDIETDGRAGGPTLEDAGYDFHLVGFPALCRVAGLTRPPALHVRLQVAFAQLHSRGTAVDHTADGSAMTLTE